MIIYNKTYLIKNILQKHHNLKAVKINNYYSLKLIINN
jgi:hypothetical protein